MAFAVKEKRLLTIPNLKLVVGEPRYVKVTGEMHVGKEIKSRRGSTEQKKEPATIVDAINLETGEQCQVICSAVVKGVFEDDFPNHTYVGKCFSITKLERKEGKDYNGFRIVEIEDPTPETESAPQGGKHKR